MIDVTVVDAGKLKRYVLWGSCLGNGVEQGGAEGTCPPFAVGRPLVLRLGTVESPSVGVPTTVGGSNCCLLFLTIRDAPRILESQKKSPVRKGSSPQASFTAETEKFHQYITLRLSFPIFPIAATHIDCNWDDGQYDD